MALARGYDIPDAISGAPELTMGLEIFLEAFNELGRDRDIAFDGIAPIKRRAIRQWIKDCEINSDADFEVALVHHVEALDGYYRDFAVKKSKRDQSTKEFGRGLRERTVSKANPKVRTGRAGNRK